MAMHSINNMIREFSAPVIKYILHEIPPYVGLVVLQADQDAKIKNWYGPLDKYFDSLPVENNDIEEYAPFLVGMLPPLVNPMVISHIQVKENTYAEIHILADEYNQNWIFIIDQTRQVEIIHPIIQLFNEEKLGSITDKKQSSSQGTLSALYLLDYMSFEKMSDGYKLLGNTPAWFEEINGKLHFSSKNIELTETFPFLEVFHYEAEEIWNAPHDGKFVSGLWEENKKNGEKIYLQALALRHIKRNYLLIKPLNDQSDINDGFIQKARDQKLTLDQLASTEKKLKQLLSFKDQFVSIISHDLRSPIGAVIGLANLLLSDTLLLSKMNNTQLELLSDIKNEMLRLLDYNDKLFQWSNLELGNFRISRKSILPEHIASYVEKMQAAKLRDKSITFIKEIDPDFKLNADETLLGHALNNLVGNAVKFTPSGGTIALTFIKNLSGSYILVKDNGMGMDDETRNHLFSGFTRKTTVGTFGEKGTGLGLGIVKKIIDAHDFSIKVESKTGQGSTFIIKIID